MEIWKRISETNYEVSTIGKIRNVRTGNELKQQVSKKGYSIITIRILDNKCKNKTLSVHRLVAMQFIQNVKNKSQVNHINGIKTDNRVENLEWCSNLENQIHARRLGLQINKKGNQLSFSKSIIQYDLQGIFVKEWESIQSTKSEFNYQNIWKCCNNKRKTANGYVWKYKL